MSKDKKDKKVKKQPVLPQKRKDEDLRAVFARHFPGALQPTANGGFAVSKAALQLALSPAGGEIIDEGLELRWVGKREAYHSAYTPNDKILKPLRADSVNFDGTGNILIKGDNLDALKLLRHNYFERVRVIYIDPPYNTKSEAFVYNDNFTKSQEEVLEELGYSDEQKDHIMNIAGSATHSGWLSFMYPRLLLAKDILADDGVIFISIDDNEQAPLKMLCDEIFGEDNFVNNFIWVNNIKGRQISNVGAAKTHESILAYAKNADNAREWLVHAKHSHELMPNAYGKAEYELLKDDHGEFVIKNELHNTNRDFHEGNRGNLVFNIHYNPKTGDIKFSDVGKNPVSFDGYVLISPKNNTDGVHKYLPWRWQKSRILREKNDLHFVNTRNGWKVYTKVRNWWMTRAKDLITNIGSQNDLLDMGMNYFNHPKPLALMKFLMSLAGGGGIFMDFFAGSATTGHAVMQLNAEDGGGRKFILVQLPEVIDAENNKASHDFVAKELGKEPTIFEVAAERLRRAGKQVQKEWQNKNGNLAKGAQPPDTGFRVLEVIADKGNEMYQLPLADIKQSDLANLPLDAPHDDETILFNMMTGEGIPLDAEVTVHVKGALYQAADILFVIGEFPVKDNYAALKNARLVCVYDGRIKKDQFILALKDNFAKKIAVKGKLR